MKKLLILLVTIFIVFVGSCNYAFNEKSVSDIINSKTIMKDSFKNNLNDDTTIAFNSNIEKEVIIETKMLKDTIPTIVEKENKTVLTLPIAEINAKGQVFTFLIDTESPISFIDEHTVEKMNLTVLEEATTELEISKITYILHDKFYIKSTISHTKSSVKYHTGKEIDGVIGSDLLKKDKKLYNNTDKWKDDEEIKLLTAYKNIN